MKISVVQYNVLSQKLCDPKYFDQCLPEACESEGRWLRIRTKLLGQIKKDSVICLQEVSQTWAGRLTTMFGSRHYEFVFRLYGRNFNDYMGVGIAYPMKYPLRECRLVRIGDLIPRPEKKTTENQIKTADSLGTMLWNSASYWTDRLSTKVIDWWSPKDDDLWARARNKWNVMVMVALSDQSNDEIVVASYHMPCDFRHSTVMTLHSYYAMMEAQKFTKERATSVKGRTGLVFCGDFNFKPDSKPYQMMTEGWKAVESDFQQNSPTAIDNWFDERGFDRMTSVYRSKLGKEPLFTNYAKTIRSSEAFQATLDYIFVSSEIEVKDVIKLPQEKPEDIYNTPLPTGEEPSDHLMLGAELQIRF